MSERSLDYEFLYPGPFTMLKVRLGAGEMIKAESDAMVAMSTTIDVEGKLEGGVLGGLGRMLAGEKFFFQTLVARRGPGEVLLAHAIPGDIKAIAMNGSRPYILHWTLDKSYLTRFWPNLASVAYYM